MGNKIKINCIICNKEHWVLPTNKNTKCCSQGCANTYRANKIPWPSCNTCGILLHKRIRKKSKNIFCSKSCEGKFRRRRIIVECEICNKKIERRIYVTKLSKHTYCSTKCKYIGQKDFLKKISRKYRSYGECAIICLLRKNYNNIKFVSSDRSQLNGYELDIWIPELNIGIEYNGQHHFKPVYGEKVFEKTKKSDKEKLEIAKEKNIKIVYIIPNGNTSKTKLQTLFIKCCEDIGLPVPTILDISEKEVYTEQSKNKPAAHRFINLGRKMSPEVRMKMSDMRSKPYTLKSPTGEIIVVNKLKKFCIENNIQYTWLVSQFKKNNPCKGWIRIN